jgi:hypothetical protein
VEQENTIRVTHKIGECNLMARINENDSTDGWHNAHHWNTLGREIPWVGKYLLGCNKVKN